MFLSYSVSIKRDQLLLKQILIQASGFLQNVKLSETKVQKLTEQLAAAENLARANKTALEKAKEQVK